MAARKRSGEPGRTSAPAAESKTGNPESKTGNPKTGASKNTTGRGGRKIELLSSNLRYEGPLFRVYTDELRENGREITRDVIRHDGSVVILAIDDSRSKKDPMVVLERQYRHAAGQFLLELPAGKLGPGEPMLAGAKRELMEETGLEARRWRKLVRYFASPGFLGEWMQVFVAEGIIAGKAKPEYDEQIEVEMVPFSEVLGMIERGKIHDGKTLLSLLLYSRLRRQERTGAL